MDNHVTKELFETKMEGLEEILDVKFDANKEEHKKISDQQAITNGSVKDLKAWRLGLAMSWTIVTIMFPAFFYYFMLSNELETKQTIDTMIMDNNEIIIGSVATEVNDYLYKNVEQIYYNE